MTNHASNHIIIRHTLKSHHHQARDPKICNRAHLHSSVVCQNSLLNLRLDIVELFGALEGANVYSAQLLRHAIDLQARYVFEGAKKFKAAGHELAPGADACKHVQTSEHCVHSSTVCACLTSWVSAGEATLSMRASIAEWSQERIAGAQLQR
jgi:hypothetical protein